MSPSLYDLLDVDESATEAEIREAWKAAIADLGPTDRRFRAYNQAAEVLLDPEQRAAYDAEHAAPQAQEPEAAEPAEAEPEAEVSEAEEPEAEEPEAGPDVDEDESGDEGAAAPATPAWMPAAVAVVAAAVLVVTVVAWVRFFPSPDDEAWVDSAIDAAVEVAPKALAYDYRSFDDDISTAQDLMTADQRARHNKLMADLRGVVINQKAVVESQVVGSGLVRGDEERADILLLVNQHTTKRPAGAKQPEEVLIPLWVTFEMVREDGEWLLDRMVNEAEVSSSGDDDTAGGSGTTGNPSPTGSETSPSPTEGSGGGGE